MAQPVAGARGAAGAVGRRPLAPGRLAALEGGGRQLRPLRPPRAAPEQRSQPHGRRQEPQEQALQAQQQQQQQVQPDDGLEVSSPPRQQAVVRQPATVPPGSKLAVGLAALAGATLLIAAFRVFRRLNDPRVKQQMLGRKNKLVVESLAEYLPGRRQELSSKETRRLSMKTGFKPEEIFRKYLWFLLKERSFDRTALDDLVHLKQVLRLSDFQVAEAVYARAERIQKRYGTVMLDTAGMTTAGVERKATTRALFSKLLFLSEYEPLCPTTPATEPASITKLFGVSPAEAEQFQLDDLG